MAIFWIVSSHLVFALFLDGEPQNPTLEEMMKTILTILLMCCVGFVFTDQGSHNKLGGSMGGELDPVGAEM